MSNEQDADPSVEIAASGLSFYPEAGPADASVYERLCEMWGLGRAFVVLAGPPGVGKTRAAEDYVIEMLRARDAKYPKQACRISELFPDYQETVYSEADIRQRLNERGITFVWDICVLHPQYAYEDLIRGIRIGANENGLPELRVREGILGFTARVAEILEQAAPDKSHPSALLVLDEINRAAVGQLFGEAIFALDRRGTPVATPHNLPGYGCQMVIPANLFLVGTMNSVDRAISGFDFALKRRFATLTIGPTYSAIENRYSTSSQRVKTIVERLYRRFETMVLSSTQIGVVPVTELVIGQAYYLAPPEMTDDGQIVTWLAQSVQYQILPALLDYREQGLVDYDPSVLANYAFCDVLLGKKPLAALTTDEIESLITQVPEHQSQDG